MVAIKGFKTVDYDSLRLLVSQALEKSEKSEMKIALEIEVSSPQTIKNSINEEGQIVSDKVLTSVMKVVGVNGFIVWANGERLYFISNKK